MVKDNWMIIKRTWNSWGMGYIIRAELEDSYYFPERAYYGYSKRDAIARYRAEFGIKYRKFNYCEY